MKGISAIVTILFLIILLIVIIASVFIFTSVVQKSALQSSQESEENFIGGSVPFTIEGVESGTIYVRAIAGRSVENKTMALYIDDQKLDFASDNLLPNRITTLNISDGLLAAGNYRFKLTAGLVQTNAIINVPKTNLLKEPSFQDSPRRPLNVVLVLDRSGSMDDDCGGDGRAQAGETPCKINDAKTAAITFVDMTDSAKDKIAVVSFSDTARLNQNLTFNRTRVKGAINSLNASGSTGIGFGIGNATKELLTDIRDARKIQILLTDGLETRNSNPVQKAREAAAQNITIYTIGLGSDVDVAQLETIANITGGKYYFSPTGSQLISIFTEIGTQLGVGWVKVGDTAIESFGAVCSSPDRCVNFTGDVYPVTFLYQDVKIVFSNMYNVQSNAQVFSSGSVCSNKCPKLPGETCADNDARIRLIALDSSNNILGETTSAWGSTKGSGWVTVDKSWITPANTQKIRFQIDAGDCCASCSATNVYVDNTRMEISKP